MTKIALDGGKYTVTHNHGADLKALRYGEPWRDLTGDGLVLAMTHEIENQAKDIEELQAAHKHVCQQLEAMHSAAQDLANQLAGARAALDGHRDLVANFAARLDEIHSWILSPAPADDLMQNAERIAQVADIDQPYQPRT